MKTRINKIAISGFRGVKKQAELDLNGKSVLLYGDNGTGKSTIADAIEWFYYEKVKHLSNEEIGRDGKEALRNAYIEDSEPASINIDLSSNNLSNNKKLNLKKGKLVIENSSDEADFFSYIEKSRDENLILRYQDLRNFVDSTKTDKLKYFSDIIGFSEVTKVKDVIKKSFNAIKSEIRNGGYENQRQAQQKTLLESIGENIYTDNQLFDKINELIKPLKTGILVKNISDIDTVIERIKKPADTLIVEKLAFLQKSKELLLNTKTEINQINEQYSKYFNEYSKLFEDVESLKQKVFEDLLKSGKHILSQSYYTANSCPLCLQEKTKQDLLKEIEKRLSEIEISSRKLKVFDNLKNETKEFVERRITQVNSILQDKLIQDEKQLELKKSLEHIKNKFTSIIEETNVKLLSGKILKNPETINLSDSDFNYLTELENQIKLINDNLKKDNVSDIRVKIEFAKNSFNQLLQINSKLEKLNKQKDSIEIIYNSFAKKQKEGLEAFLSGFSSQINDYYQFMNTDESFKDIKIVPIEDEEDEELKGITIQFIFNGQEVSPLQKYLSESHLNCYGLAFFLASVGAKTENNFIVLDDIISSFDTTHRKRFADLIFEKFSSYQIILLTHESEWYKYISVLAKNKGWLLSRVNWSEEAGTHFEEAPLTIRERIIRNIANNNEVNLGNDIRIYLEYLLKEIAFNLEVKVKYLPNETNEMRMSPELLDALTTKIEKCNKTIIQRTKNSNIIGNLLSHYNGSFNAKIGDLKAFWKDILELEGIFICDKSDCSYKFVSYKYFDNVKNIIRCGCATKGYNWKK